MDRKDRRDFLKFVFALPFCLPVMLRPTPMIADEEEATPSLTAGPFFKPNSPKRTSLLEPGLTGTKLVLSGLVLSTGGRPIPGALLDFWQADANGNYDNAGYRLRGHQFTDNQGRYTLETIVPGGYSGRTRHIHVKVRPSNGHVLTTQLFFPGEPRNENDFLFRPELLMKLADARATFDFVLAT